MLFLRGVLHQTNSLSLCMGFEATNPLVEGLSLTPSCPSCLTIMAAVHSDFDPSTCALFTIVNRMLAGDHKSSFWNAIRGGPLSGRLRHLAWRHSIHKPMAATAKNTREFVNDVLDEGVFTPNFILAVSLLYHSQAISSSIDLSTNFINFST